MSVHLKAMTSQRYTMTAMKTKLNGQSKDGGVMQEVQQNEKFNFIKFATDTLNGILFKGNSIIEWRGKRTMDYGTRNSFQNSCVKLRIINGKTI